MNLRDAKVVQKIKIVVCVCGGGVIGDQPKDKLLFITLYKSKISCVNICFSFHLELLSLRHPILIYMS